MAGRARRANPPIEVGGFFEPDASVRYTAAMPNTVRLTMALVIGIL